MGLKIGIMAHGVGALKRGGVDVYTRDLVAALAAHGREHEYHVLLHKEEVPWTSRAMPAHVRFAPVRGGRLAYYGWRIASKFNPPPGDLWEAHRAWEFDQTAARLGLDLIHYPATTVWPLGIKTPCTLMFWDLQHEYFPEFFSHGELARRRVTYPASLGKARRVFVPSAYTEETLRAKMSDFHGNAALLPPGIDQRFKPPTSAEIDRVRTKYQLPKRFLFYPARFWPHKNHGLLLEAQELHRDRYGELPQLVFSGGSIEEFAASRGAAAGSKPLAGVKAIGLVPEDDLPALYGAATGLIFPSLFEGFGLPLVEAMACGCPVAAANATSIPSVLKGAGLLFDPKDREDLCEKMYQLLVNAETRDRLARLGVERALDFSWEQVVARLEESLGTILNET